MSIKQHILLIFFALLAFTSVQAQLTFDPAAWDFGKINEADGRVSHIFTATNQGDKPLVILDVVSTCGCTVPVFSRQPVLPGAKAQITVTFDPANRPGTFIKELGVYSSEKRKIASLTISGQVAPRQKSLAELYPVDAGGGLRLSGTLCTFTYIYPGQRVSSSISYVNTSDRKIRLDLPAKSRSGLLKVESPREIAPGERGQIHLSYLISTESPRYGTLHDVLELLVDGRGNGTLLMAHGIGVDDPTSFDQKSKPQAQLSESTIKFGPVKHDSPLLRRTFLLSNTGGSELIVRAVESDGRIGTTLAPGRKIAPGDNCRVELTLDPSAQEYGVMTDHLVLVTNDPAQPMRRLRVTAIIED